jgi:hypothetical protein
MAEEPEEKKQDALTAELEAHGVALAREACGSDAAEVQELCKACHEELVGALERMLALPGPMSASAPPERHFIAYTTSGAADATAAAATAASSFSHRREFVIPLKSSKVEALLKAILKTTRPGGGGVGKTLAKLLGEEAEPELQELTCIISEPGAKAQGRHSDNTWDGTQNGDPRLITTFIAIHDIPDEALGPTRFWPDTHTPEYFPAQGGRWCAPDDRAVKDKEGPGEGEGVWFPLKAADAVMMNPLCWHQGGANTTGSGTNPPRRRALLSMSWVAGSGSGNFRLSDFIK